MKLIKCVAVLLALLVSSESVVGFVLFPWIPNHQWDSLVQPKHTHHQIKSSHAPLVARPMAKHVWHVMKRKVTHPVFEKQAYAIPKYAKHILPNGQEIPMLVGVYHYQRLRLI